MGGLKCVMSSLYSPLTVVCSLSTEWKYSWLSPALQEWMCAKWAVNGCQGQSRNAMTTAREGNRGSDKDTCTSLPTQPPAQGYDPSALPLSTTQQKCISQTSAWVSTVRSDHWRGLASCWVGEFEGFFPQLTVHESTKCAIKAICSWSVDAAQWRQTAEMHRWHAVTGLTVQTGGKWGKFTSSSLWDSLRGGVISQARHWWQTAGI